MKKFFFLFSKLIGISFIFSCLFLLCSAFQGISYQRLFLPGLHVLHVLEVDPHFFKIEPVHANDLITSRKTVQELVQEHGAVAGINGGFFKLKPWAGIPAGILKINGRWFAWPNKPRGAIGWSADGTHVLMDRLLCEGYLKIKEEFFAIQGINCERKNNEIIVYFPTFSSKTPSSNGFDIIIRQNQFIAVFEGGNHFIPSDGYVISFGTKQWLPFWIPLAKGTPLTLAIDILPQESFQFASVWNSFPHIVGGTPLLVHEGKLISDFSAEKTLDSFINQPHTRTAIGILANGNWLFVVFDGQTDGVTIPELAQTMYSLGCVEALNLDGGGSSTLVINNRVVNHPQGILEDNSILANTRAVSDAILIKTKL